MNVRIALPALLPASLILFTACGSGGGGGGGGRIPSTGTATVAFPTASAVTSSEQITVTGSAMSPDGIQSVMVNGTAATTGNLYADWTATVPLNMGANTLQVSVTDGAGRQNTNAATVNVDRLGAVLSSPRDLAFDPMSGNALVTDRDLQALAWIADAGTVNVVSDAATGTGTTLSRPEGVDFDSGSQLAYVIVTSPAGLLEVDTRTGDRRTISSSTVGSGTNFSTPNSVALDMSRNRALVTDSARRLLLAVNLATGNRSTLSNFGTTITAVVMDEPAGRALVVDSQRDAIVAVDLITGARTDLSRSGVGIGPVFQTPSAIAINAGHTMAYVTDPGLDAVFEVDLSNGDRRIISDANFGQGPTFEFPDGIDFDTVRNRVLVNDRERDAVFAVDPTTGERSYAARASAGSGPELSGGVRMATDAQRNRVLLVERTTPAIVAIDLATGDRSILSSSASSATVGQGPDLDGPWGIAIDEANSRALVVSQGTSAVIAVDLITGDRTTLSRSRTPTVGSGQSFSNPKDIALDLPNRRALVTVSTRTPIQATQIVAMDLETGTRTLLSERSTGSGPQFFDIEGIEVDTMRNQALVIDEGYPGLLRVDLGTGNREMISDNGRSPLLFATAHMDLDSANERVLVVQQGSNGVEVMEIDYIDGNRRTLLGPQIGRGPQLYSSISIAMSPQRNTVILLDTSLSAAFAATLSSGDRAILSK